MKKQANENARRFAALELYINDLKELYATIYSMNDFKESFISNSSLQSKLKYGRKFA